MPKDKGARPYRHGGSPLHWDKECKYSSRWAARTRLCGTSVVNLQAQDDLLSEKEDFDCALQVTNHEDRAVSVSALKGNKPSEWSREDMDEENSAPGPSPAPSSTAF
ncbi:hypothetical protein PM082_001555 [Marasmius tenuissimus]|nr:hypothetical protein PM082_001555 [Marasmius tenuissimus]